MKKITKKGDLGGFVTLEFRDLMVYFTQIFIIVFLIGVSLLKLVFFKLEFEESTFWFSLLSCTVGYALPKPKL